MKSDVPLVVFATGALGPGSKNAGGKDHQRYK
jgi:hypothetical protein